MAQLAVIVAPTATHLSCAHRTHACVSPTPTSTIVPPKSIGSVATGRFTDGDKRNGGPLTTRSARRIKGTQVHVEIERFVRVYKDCAEGPGYNPPDAVELFDRHAACRPIMAGKHAPGGA